VIRHAAAARFPRGVDVDRRFGLSIFLTRREALAMIAAAPAALIAQGSQLPLRTSGLEHVGFTVPEPQKSAAFYGRIFDPQIFQEMMPPLRYYCRLGISYLAFGGNATSAARMDHFCATVEDYRLEQMRAELATQGMNLPGTAGFNAVTDPDGIRMQLMATPGGLLPTIIASTRVTQDDAICQAVGLDHVVLHVPDLEKAAGFYRKFFGMEAARDRAPERFGIRVAAFDRQGVARKLGAIGVTVLPSAGENALRFRDTDGIAVELRGI
jgi:catechol 2,3-dioxygenase-like lactoylglutathione lyase family enzyme